MASGRSPWVVVGLVLGALLLVVLFVGGYVRTTYNELVSQQVGTQTAWSQVENQLQRRNDLIPNLSRRSRATRSRRRPSSPRSRTPGHGSAAGSRPSRRCRPATIFRTRFHACWSSSRTIRSSSRARTSCGCKTSWPGPRTASRWSACATTRPYRPTTPTSGSSPSNLVASAFNFEAKPLFQAPESAKAAPNVKF